MFDFEGKKISSSEKETMRKRFEAILEQNPSSLIIISDVGYATMSKGKMQLMSSLTTYLQRSKNENVINDDDIDFLCEMSKMNKEQLEEECKRKFEEILKKLKEKCKNE